MKKSSILRISAVFLIVLSFLIIDTDRDRPSNKFGVVSFFAALGLFAVAFEVGTSEDIKEAELQGIENGKKEAKRIEKKNLVSRGICVKCGTNTLSLKKKQDTRSTKTVLRPRKDGSFEVGSERDGYLWLYYHCSNCNKWFDEDGKLTIEPRG